MSDDLLSTTLHQAATLIGQRLPAAFSMDAGTVVVDGDAAAHALPEGAVAVRWPLGADEAVLVVAVSAEAAAMLCAGPPAGTLGEALGARLGPAVQVLNALFTVPLTLGEPTEVAAEEALAGDPADAASVQLVDAGTHRATLALRLVISDAMRRAPSTAGSDGQSVGSGLVDTAQPPVPAGPVGLPADGMPVAAPLQAAPVDGIPIQAAPAQGVPVQAVPVQAMPVQGAPGQAMPVQGAGRQPYRDPIGPPVGDAHPADFASFDHLGSLPSQAHPLTMLADVEMGVTAELGRTRLTVRDVLALNQGSIIELDRAAGGPVDVVVNGTLIARGEVVVIDEEFGIRITEIVGMDDSALPLPLAQ